MAGSSSVPAAAVESDLDAARVLGRGEGAAAADCPGVPVHCLRSSEWPLSSPKRRSRSKVLDSSDSLDQASGRLVGRSLRCYRRAQVSALGPIRPLAPI